MASAEPAEAEQIAVYEPIPDSTGATTEDLSMATAFTRVEGPLFSVVLAYQVAGADGTIVGESFVPAYAESFEESPSEPRRRAGPRLRQW